MIKYLFRHNKDYSRFNIIKKLCKDIKTKKDIYILLPFSKNQFFKNFFKRNILINDFFISNYDTYVYDRQKISNKNPRAWWKYFQDWFNFKFSKFILSDTMAHFKYWEQLFGKYNGKHFVLPVLADPDIYFPCVKEKKTDVIKIIFYGSFIPLHGIDVILKAFSLMEKNNIKFEANIIGNGQKYNDMLSLFKQLNLKQVKMEGKFFKENDLANLIREHDIVLGIFGNSKKAKSVIPNKVYQSTACKKCTVTMYSDVINEFYSFQDLVTCDNNSKSLSNTLIELINNPNKIEDTALKGFEKFNFLYEKISLDFKEFVQKIEKEIK